MRFDEYAKSGKLPPLVFDRSGWFLIRAVTNVPKTYRFAMTGRTTSRSATSGGSASAAQFFLDWVTSGPSNQARQIPRSAKPCSSIIARREDFWRDLVEKANAE